MPVLVDHSIQGFNAMPAGGQCATCTPADLEALIRFMADREESAG
jgi:cytochrome c5